MRRKPQRRGLGQIYQYVVKRRGVVVGSWLFGKAASQEISQQRKLYYVLGGQNAHNERRLGSRMDFVQVSHDLGPCHKLADALIERASGDHVCLSIRTTLIVERRPFPRSSAGASKLMEDSPVIAGLRTTRARAYGPRALHQDQGGSSLVSGAAW